MKTSLYSTMLIKECKLENKKERDKQAKAWRRIHKINWAIAVLIWIKVKRVEKEITKEFYSEGTVSNKVGGLSRLLK